MRCKPDCKLLVSNKVFNALATGAVRAIEATFATGIFADTGCVHAGLESLVRRLVTADVCRVTPHPHTVTRTARTTRPGTGAHVMSATMTMTLSS